MINKVLVTPSSKVVGDLALALLGAGITADEFAAEPTRFDSPDSVIGFLRGELGDPPGGWPEPLRTNALEGRFPERPVHELQGDDEKLLAEPEPQRQATLNRLLFPGATKEYEAHRAQTVAIIEAMRMEAAITAPLAGTVVRVAVSATTQVEGGDLLVVIE